MISLLSFAACLLRVEGFTTLSGITNELSANSSLKKERPGVKNLGSIKKEGLCVEQTQIDCTKCFTAGGLIELN